MRSSFVCLIDGADINQNVPMTLFEKFHRNVNLLKFQKPIQLPVSSSYTLLLCVVYTDVVASYSYS